MRGPVNFLLSFLILFISQVGWGSGIDLHICQFNLEAIVKNDHNTILTLVPDFKRLHSQGEYEREIKLGRAWNVAMKALGGEVLHAGDFSFTARAEVIQKFVQQILIDNAYMTPPVQATRVSLVGSFAAQGFHGGSNLMSTGAPSLSLGGGIIRTKDGRIEPDLSVSQWIPYFLLVGHGRGQGLREDNTITSNYSGEGRRKNRKNLLIRFYDYFISK